MLTTTNTEFWANIPARVPFTDGLSNDDLEAISLMTFWELFERDTDAALDLLECLARDANDLIGLHENWHIPSD